MTGMIQLGASAARYPNEIEPAFPEAVPAAGITPIEPGWVTPPAAAVEVGLALPLPLLLQAARAVTLATATASAPMRFLLNVIIAPPSLRSSRLWSVLGSSECRPSFSQVAGDPLRTVAGVPALQ
jgi:hypothetical protein